MRIGFGYDAHRLVSGRPLVLGGVIIPHDRGLDGHSELPGEIPVGWHARMGRQDFRIDIRDDSFGQELVLRDALALDERGPPVRNAGFFGQFAVVRVGRARQHAHRIVSQDCNE